MTDSAGFVGLGVMGLPMARNLSKVVSVVGYDVSELRRRRAEESDAGPAIESVSSLEDVANRCDTVFLSLPSSGVVEEVCIGENGLGTLLKAGAVVIDTSTTEPAVSRKVSSKLGEAGIRFLDAPVSGGEQGAIDASLSFMVGGGQAEFDEARPMLEAMGASVVRVGGVGAGEIAKLVNNLIVGITFAAIAEGFALGTKGGIDPAELYRAIRGGWAGSRVLEVAAPAMLERNFEPGGTVDIHWKDLGYALSLAKEQDVPTPLTALAHEVFKAARAAGHGGESQPAVVKLWESLLGNRITDPPRMADASE